jgi:hypothetical protein
MVREARSAATVCQIRRAAGVPARQLAAAGLTSIKRRSAVLHRPLRRASYR